MENCLMTLTRTARQVPVDVGARFLRRRAARAHTTLRRPLARRATAATR